MLGQKEAARKLRLSKSIVSGYPLAIPDVLISPLLRIWRPQAFIISMEVRVAIDIVGESVKTIIDGDYKYSIQYLSLDTSPVLFGLPMII
jgi:hypothetical protein